MNAWGDSSHQFDSRKTSPGNDHRVWFPVIVKFNGIKSLKYILKYEKLAVKHIFTTKTYRLDTQQGNLGSGPSELRRLID